MTAKNFAKMLLCGLCISILWLSGCQQATVRTVQQPPTDTVNSFYVSNRAPLAPSPFAKLPIGSIKPKGWLHHMLELERDGMTGHLTEISKWCNPEGNAWLSSEGRGHSGWEELPYWLKGYGDLGYVLGDDSVIKQSRKWIEAMLSSQSPDGWFGPRSNKTKMDGKPDIWPNMIAMNCLQSYYDYSGDRRVLSLMTGYFHWQLSVPDEDFLPGSWQQKRAGDNLQSVYWLYNRTGEKWLLQLAQKVHRHTSNWTDKLASGHGVNIAQCFREPAIYYMQAKDPKFLRAAQRNYDTVMGNYGQVPGGMFGADENCRQGYTGPRQAAETCSIVEFMHSFEMLTKITGDTHWLDRCENVAFNSFPAAQTPDLKALHYLTAPNMIQLDRKNKKPGLQNGGIMLAYTPWLYRCCQHNVSHGWPYYAEELWLATADNGLCASLYCASQVTAKVADATEVTITEDTDYPFDETVKLTISTPKPVRFPLYLRIPHWSEETAISVNGKPLNSRFKPQSYAVIEQTWSNGDTVTVQFSAQIAVHVWKKNKNSVSVSRGPLTYSLKIGEKWVRYEGKSGKPDNWIESIDNKWPAYEVYPTTPWNYGLVLNDISPQTSFEVVKKTGPVALQPFTPQTAPIELRAKARIIPTWTIDDLGLVGKLPQSPAQSDEPIQTITLIPMGCARLRISAFPVANK